MASGRRRRMLGFLLAVPALGLLFWLTSMVASSWPPATLLNVNVHGLTSTFDSGNHLRPAPLSLSVLVDAEQDANPSAPAAPTPTPTPTRRPVATPTATPRPTAAPTPTATPSPSAPLPSPSLPVVTPSSTPVTSYGSLNGLVLDSATRLPISGASVRLSNGIVRVSNLAGSFSYTLILSGSYTITVSKTGYKTQSQAVTVTATVPTTVTVRLAHG